MDDMYLNEFHKQQSLETKELLSKMPRMSLKEALEQYKRVMSAKQQPTLKEEKENETEK